MSDLWPAPRAPPTPSTGSSRCPAASRSPTAPWCSPRSPTGPASYAVRCARATRCSWRRRCLARHGSRTPPGRRLGVTPGAVRPRRRRRLRPRRHGDALRAAGRRAGRRRRRASTVTRTRGCGPSATMLSALRDPRRRDRRRRSRRAALHRPRARVGARRDGHHRRQRLAPVRLGAAARGRPLRRTASTCATSASRCPRCPTSR